MCKNGILTLYTYFEILLIWFPNLRKTCKSSAVSSYIFLKGRKEHSKNFSSAVEKGVRYH